MVLLRAVVRLACAILLVVPASTMTGTADQQTREQRAAPPRPGDADRTAVAAALGRGWAALADGRLEDAVRAADEVLARASWHHGALGLKIEALAASKPLAALDAYEGWLAPGMPEDVALLIPVAAGVLWELAQGNDEGLRVQALERLAAAGSESARATLRSRPPDVSTDAALVRLADSDAIERLEQRAAAQAGDLVAVARALEPAGARAVSPLTVLLSSRSGPARAAAATALGRIGSHAALDELSGALKDPDPFVRASAAVALARLGQPHGEEYVGRMLKSEVADLRIMAAQAWDGSGPWVSAVRPLLEDQGGLTRFQAARLIARVDPEAASRILREGLQHRNPVIRAEAAGAIEELATRVDGVSDVGALRQRLRDADSTIRLHAAGTLLKLGVRRVGRP